MPNELGEIKEMLIAMKTDITEIRVHGKYTKETLVKHDGSIGELEKQNNKQKGAMWGLGALLSGGIIERVIEFFNK